MKYQKKDLETFSHQIQFALQNYKPHGLKAENFNNVILAGLGGSGIAARIVKSYLSNEFPLPVEVISEYNLPAYANAKTLVIFNSYSGNTEETLEMFEDARKKGCTKIAMCAGGKLQELAQKNGLIFYKAEDGFQPRMALGYSLTYLLLALGELMGKNMQNAISEAAEAVKNTEHYIEKGRKLFEQLGENFTKKTVLITDQYTYPIGVRFSQQVQENAKAEAFVHDLPETNHNVIESYYNKLDSVFIFLNSNNHERTNLRFKFLKDVLDRGKNQVITLDLKPGSLKDYLELIYVLDWLSLWMADAKGVKSIDVAIIRELKEYLAER